MELEQFISNLDEALDYIDNDLQKRIQFIVGNDLVAMISDRVIQTGINSEGQKFTPYSEKKINRGRFKNKERRNVSLPTSLSYKDFRLKNGLPVDKKTFSFTNEMWRKFGIIKVTKNLNDFVVTLGGLNVDSQFKINVNSEREGISIIGASESEIAIVTSILDDILDEEITKILNNE